MFTYEKSSSITHLSVLAGLWLVNILIVIFGSPFLIYKKIKGIFLKAVKKTPPNTAAEPKSAQYFPCRN